MFSHKMLLNYNKVIDIVILLYYLNKKFRPNLNLKYLKKLY